MKNLSTLKTHLIIEDVGKCRCKYSSLGRPYQIISKFKVDFQRATKKMLLQINLS